MPIENCGSMLIYLMIRLNSKQLRDISEEKAQEHTKGIKHNKITLILENVYDTYNIGGIFRLADALSVEKIYLCADMETPPNHKIKKASVGTYKIVPWEYKETAIEAINQIKNENKETQIIAVEQDKNSVPYRKIEYSLPVAIIVGNETFGVLPETLKECDKIAEIPMWGINKSLNVIVSAAIVSYHIASNLINK